MNGRGTFRSVAYRLSRLPTADMFFMARAFPDHPSVKDVSEKAELFDEAAAKFSIPSLPTVTV